MSRANQKYLITLGTIVLLLIIVGAFFIFRGKDEPPTSAPVNLEDNLKKETAEKEMPQTKDIDRPDLTNPDTKKSEASSGVPNITKDKKVNSEQENVTVVKEPILIQKFATATLWGHTLFYDYLSGCSQGNCRDYSNVVYSYNLETNQKKVLLDESLDKGIKKTPVTYGYFAQADDSSLYYMVSAYFSPGRVYYLSSPAENKMGRLDIDILNPSIEKIGDTVYLEGGYGDGCGSGRDIYIFDQEEKKVVKKLVSTSISCGDGESIIDLLEDGAYIWRGESENYTSYSVIAKEIYQLKNENPKEKIKLISEEDMPPYIFQSYYEKEKSLEYLIGLQGAHIFDFTKKEFIKNINYPREVADTLVKKFVPENVGSDPYSTIWFEKENKTITILDKEKIYNYDLESEKDAPVVIENNEKTKRDWDFIEQSYGDGRTSFVFKQIPQKDQLLAIGGDELFVYDTNTGDLDKSLKLPEEPSTEQFYALDAGDKDGMICLSLDERRSYGKSDYYRERISTYSVDLTTGGFNVVDRSSCYTPYVPSTYSKLEEVRQEVKQKFDRDIVFTD